MKSLNKIKFILFSFLFLIMIFYSLKNTLVVGGKFILSNITIRESFFYENNIIYKGTHEPGQRYLNLLEKNYSHIKNFNFSEIKEIIKKIKTIDINKTDYSLEYELMKTLSKLDKLPISEKKISAIYIPKNIDVYWNISCDRFMAPFITPAITNILMIDGLPIHNIDSCFQHRREYGYARYIEYNKKSSWNKLSPKALCRKANKDNIKKIIELIEVEKRGFNTITYNCKDFK